MICFSVKSTALTQTSDILIFAVLMYVYQNTQYIQCTKSSKHCHINRGLGRTIVTTMQLKVWFQDSFAKSWFQRVSCKIYVCFIVTMICMPKAFIKEQMEISHLSDAPAMPTTNASKSFLINTSFVNDSAPFIYWYRNLMLAF